MKYFPLFSLPSELVIAVLQQLDIPDLLVCKQVCRPLNSLISTTLSFQYSTALYLSGLAECAPSPLPTTERLALLRRHFLAWKHLQPSLRCSIPLSSHNSTLYELYGGVFARGTALPSRSAWGEDTRPRRKTNGMYVVDLPSEVSGLGASSWERQDVGFVVADFTLDRAQDLWVGVERSYATGRAPFLIHLRLLSTNAPHPLARSASLVHTLSYPLPHAHDQQDVVTHYTMQVCGGMLGVLFQHHPVEDVGGVKREELIVWDWKRGVRVAEITPEEAQEEEAHSFSFLAEDLLLLAKTTFDEGLLDIVQLPPSSAIPIPSPSPPGPGATPRERRHWREQMAQLPRASRSSFSSQEPQQAPDPEREAYRIATFRLPKLRREWMYTSIVSRSDPAPIPEPFAFTPAPPPPASGPPPARPPRRRRSSSVHNSPVRGEFHLLPEPAHAREPLFQPRPEARLFVFTLHLLSLPANQACSLLLFVHLDTLLRPVREYRAAQAGLRDLRAIAASLGGGPLPPLARPAYTTIPWSAWARRTRLIQERDPASHLCYVAGWRYVSYDHVPAVLGPHAGACVVRVLDFNPVSLRKELLEGGDPLEDAPTGVVRRLNTQPSGEVRVFAEKDRGVETSLPYAECIAQAVFPDAMGVLLDMERIIVLRRVGGRQVLDVLAF